MKIFIASPWRNRTDVRMLSDVLTVRGYAVYSYLQNTDNSLTGLSIEDELKTFTTALTNWETDPQIKNIFDSEVASLKSSDMVIVLGPVGHSSLIEAGIGYGLGKRVIIIGPIEKPEVFYLIGERYPDVDSFLNSLDASR
jgi:hypothetical protein